MRLILCALMALFLAHLAPGKAQAQSAVCVYLEPGAGYAAYMRLTHGGFDGPWSGSFPIGQHACMPLGDIADGQQYSVQVNAMAGNTVTCEPATLTRDAGFAYPITFFANKGTTLNHKCYLLQ